MNNTSRTLKTVNLKKHFATSKEPLVVLNDITVCFEHGKRYAITGASGSGKSTFIHLLAGLDTPTHGCVQYNNQDIQTFSTEKREDFLHATIGLVFQQPYLIRELSVIENVMIRSMIQGEFGHDNTEHAVNLLEKLGIADKATCKPASLSGGQQQRVALARALSNRPAFLLADEPTGSVDEKTGTEMLNLLIACQQEWGMGFIVSTHNQVIANNMETVYHLHNGNLITR